MLAGLDDVGPSVRRGFFFGGGVAVIGRVLMSPIESVKLTHQFGQHLDPRIISGQIPRYTGISNCFSRVLSEKGIGTFYRGGLNPFNPKAWAGMAALFAIKEATESRIINWTGEPNLLVGQVGVNFASGAVAAFGSACITSMLNLFRMPSFEYEVDDPRHRWIVKEIDQHGQIKSKPWCLIAKPSSSMISWGVIRSIPHWGFHFGFNEMASRCNPLRERKHFTGYVSRMACAMSAGVCANFACVPFSSFTKGRIQSAALVVKGILRGLLLFAFGEVKLALD